LRILSRLWLDLKIQTLENAEKVAGGWHMMLNIFLKKHKKYKKIVQQKVHDGFER